jgi:FAD/FMN-containing dehydrogenase
VGGLTGIVSIDPERRVCICEAGVSFSDLTEATLRYGLAPTVVPELRGITVGGAVVGCSVESMSFRYGGFHDSCLSYELVTGTGELLNVGRSKAPEVFHMIHGSFGTLGILTLAEFQLVPAQDYVELRYEHLNSFASLLESVRGHYEAGDVDFMDAIVHARDHHVLCLGNFRSDDAGRRSDPGIPYYRSTEELEGDCLPTRDYFFRFDSDCHWIARRYGLENPILRKLAGRYFLGSDRILGLAKKLPFLVDKSGSPDVIADVFIPYRYSEEFFSWYADTFDYFPLWVVPYRIPEMYPWVNPHLVEDIHDPLFIDFATYGFPQPRGTNYYRLLERRVAELHGMKTLITHNYYPRSEFWRIFNPDTYRRTKQRVDPHNLFRGIYAKTNYTQVAPEGG